MLPLKPSYTLATALLALLAAQPAFALDNDQIASVFGAGATDLTGNSIQLPQFMFTVVTNTTHALMSLNSSAQSFQVGWMGVGSGTAMANADFLVAWPNPDGISGAAATPWTLSHRRSAGEAQPVVASTASATSTDAFYTFLPDLSTTSASPFTAITFLRPLEAPSDYPSTSTYESITRGATPFIYASSTVQPGSSDEGAVITQHNQAHSDISLDLSTPISLASAGTSSGDGNSGGTGAENGTPVVSTSTGRTTRDMYLIAHAVCASLALVLFAPAAVLLARFLRGSTWYPAHAGLNALAGVLIVVAFALGVHATRGDHFSDTHQRLGLVIFIIIVLQVLLGAFAHSRPVHPSPAGRLPTLSKKSPFRLFHIFLGIAVLVLGYINVHEGFQEWEEASDATTKVPMGVEVVFYVLLGVTAVAYVVGWGLEAMGRNRPSKTDDGQHHAEKIVSGAS